jgi:hypothetical protein
MKLASKLENIFMFLFKTENNEMNCWFDPIWNRYPKALRKNANAMT